MQTGTLPGKNILIADDSEMNQTVLKLFVSKLGAIPHFADNGKQAIKGLEQSNFQLILMDIEMPGMNGIEATKHIRQQMRLSIPIVGVSGHAVFSERQKALDAGMNDYLSKPFTMVDLKLTMEKAIDQHKHKLFNQGIEIDLGIVYEVSANDMEYARLMIHTFLNTMPRTIANIKAAYDAKDWHGLYKAAHFSKSSLSVIKVGDMLEVSKAIEVSARTEQNLEQIENLIEQLTRQYAKAEKILQVHFPAMEAENLAH